MQHTQSTSNDTMHAEPVSIIGLPWGIISQLWNFYLMELMRCLILNLGYQSTGYEYVLLYMWHQ